MGYLSMLVAEV